MPLTPSDVINLFAHLCIWLTVCIFAFTVQSMNSIYLGDQREFLDEFSLLLFYCHTKIDDKYHYLFSLDAPQRFDNCY